MVLKKEHQIYKIISSIILEGSLKILSDNYNEEKESFNDKQNKISSNNDYKYKNFIITNSIELLKIIKNEVDDLINPGTKKRNTVEQSEKLKNIIATNFKNYSFNNSNFLDSNEKEKMFLNIAGAINHYKVEEKELAKSCGTDI